MCSFSFSTHIVSFESRNRCTILTTINFLLTKCWFASIHSHFTDKTSKTKNSIKFINDECNGIRATKRNVDWIDLQKLTKLFSQFVKKFPQENERGSNCVHMLLFVWKSKRKPKNKAFERVEIAQTEPKSKWFLSFMTLNFFFSAFRPLSNMCRCCGCKFVVLSSHWTWKKKRIIFLLSCQWLCFDNLMTS